SSPATASALGWVGFGGRVIVIVLDLAAAVSPAAFLDALARRRVAADGTASPAGDARDELRDLAKEGAESVPGIGAEVVGRVGLQAGQEMLEHPRRIIAAKRRGGRVATLK